MLRVVSNKSLFFHDWECFHYNLVGKENLHLGGSGFVIRILHVLTPVLLALRLMLRMKDPTLGEVGELLSIKNHWGMKSAIEIRAGASVTKLLPQPHSGSLGGEISLSNLDFAVLLWFSNWLHIRSTWEACQMRIPKLHFPRGGVGPRGLSFYIRIASENGIVQLPDFI